ncbi:MAG: 4Fe-4S dicluster domain-containing protein [Deltaproteobacteria bacterium]|nr:4Fe-4S dicluster domain-containing protein [Deltaproteobacteria bacterium]MCB9788294.1 4Fe-4S dicluster domain-containing protein [Deltaproteobacteria bacterium]
MSDTMKHPRHWRSLDELSTASLDAATAAGSEMAAAQTLDGAAELTVDGVSRRQFIALMGASTALAGVGLEGCVRKPVEHILPFAHRPENMVPGRPIYYASTWQLGTSVAGVVVESQDGRPTKVEGNPEHPASRGPASTFAQASVFGFYDPERSRTPMRGDAPATWDQAWATFDEALAPVRAAGGEGLALVVDTVMSPTHRAQLAELSRTMPKARIFVSDRLWPAEAFAGAAMVGGPKALAVPSLAGAKVIVALDGDVLVSEGDALRHARDFAAGRAVDVPKPDMNRLYAIGPVFDATAAMADHRLRVRASEVGTVLRALVATLLDTPGVDAGSAGGLKAALGTPALDDKQAAFVKALARDMVARKGQAVVLTGHRQPAWVHALAHLANTLVGADGKTVTWRRDADRVEGQTLAELKAGLDDGSIKSVVVIGANPAYDAPGELKLAASLAKAGFIAHAGLYRDETGALAHLHMPLSHYLEAWGDLSTLAGEQSVVQPLIAPLYGSPSPIELTARLLTGQPAKGLDLVRATWTRASGGGLDERAWRRWLHSGLIDAPAPGGSVTPSYAQLGANIPAPAAAPAGYEVVFTLDSRVLDGRFANNGWLQELPDTITKLTWDNAALVSAKTAGELGVVPGQMVKVGAGSGSVELPVWVAPGVAERTVVLPLGFGRKNLGSVAEGAGFDVYPLTTHGSPWLAAGASVAAGVGSYELATTQTHDRLEPGFDFPARPLVREATISHYEEEPRFVEAAELMPPDDIRSPFQQPALTGAQQWGMTIDLNACTGCNACTMACNAENNIVVVGKARVLKGREMHWIRIDRYYVGDDPDEPQAVVQPVNCQQCETAPCETVCPVAATTHSPEGLNDMAYNRCVGTRYCSNNCPFKVRRFNFFNYNLDIDAVAQMQKNPDVTLRFRGVMEKCTYCTQRISEARIAAKVAGSDVIADGVIQTACQQTCPTNAIVFGDLRDPQSRVSQLKASPRNYVLLRELNVQPRTSYLARIRNPNPELV